jgi:hypothetical protein
MVIYVRYIVVCGVVFVPSWKGEIKKGEKHTHKRPSLSELKRATEYNPTGPATTTIDYYKEGT